MKRYKEYRNMKAYEQSCYRYKCTSTIMLKGQWLWNLGFEEDVSITVRCEGGRLTITRADEIVTDFREITAESVMCVAEPSSKYGKQAVYV